MDKQGTARVCAGRDNSIGSGATLQLTGNINEIDNNARVTVNSGGVLDMPSGQTETLTNLTLSGTGISGGGALINSAAGYTSTMVATPPPAFPWRRILRLAEPATSR